MANLLSPGIAVAEKDFSSVVRQASSSTGAFVGQTTYGPIGEVTVVTDESTFVNTFGKPNSQTADDFMSVSSFLSYTDDLRFVRVANRNTFNATSSEEDVSTVSTKMTLDVTVSEGVITGISVPVSASWNSNIDEENSFIEIVPSEGYTGTGASAIPEFENGVLVSVTILSGGTNYTQGKVVAELRTGIQIATEFEYDTKYMHSTTTKYGQFVSKYAGTKGNGLRIEIFDSSSNEAFEGWKYSSYFSGVPSTSDYVASRGGSNDEFHLVIIDGNGQYTGVQDEVLAYHGFISKAKDAVDNAGDSIYWRKVLADGNYIYALCPPDYNETYQDDESHELTYTETTNWDSEAQGTDFGRTREAVSSFTLSGGTLAECTDADYMNAWDKLSDPEEYDVSLLFAGNCTSTVLNYLMGTIVTPVGSTTGRAGTSILCFSPPKELCLHNNGREAESIKKWAGALPHSNYYVCDCNWKYMYDRYNEVYRWTPCCADVAGLCALTDNVADPWWSPAGLNRGRIKNAIKLAWNPKRPERDILYQQGVNSIYSMTGEGVVLFGDKTFTNKPSAFDRINVRRLFIVLEKSIAFAAKYLLFEFNDDITRAQFRAMVEPFLRNVQGLRGITDYRVVCDETNNTPYVIDNNQFVGDIYVRPNYSINYNFLQ